MQTSQTYGCARSSLNFPVNQNFVANFLCKFCFCVIFKLQDKLGGFFPLKKFTMKLNSFYLELRIRAINICLIPESLLSVAKTKR